MIKQGLKKVIRTLMPDNRSLNNPFKRWITDTDYVYLKNYRRFQDGRLEFMDRPLEFSDSIGLIHSLEEIFIDEIYNFDTKQIKPTIIDCGSNIGLSIIYFKSIFPEAKVLGFEPDPKIFQLLKKNISAFNLHDVEVFETAVWTHETTLKFHSEGSLAGSTEISNYNHQSYSVKTTDLKRILSKESVDFLKIDIEGGENTLLFDLESELKPIRYLFLEYHSIANNNQKLGEILTLLSNAGFRYYIQSANDFQKTPFKTSVKEGFDLQLNIFCKKLI